MRVGGNGQSIVSTVSDVIIRSCLWSTATRSCPLGYFQHYSKWLIIDPTISGSRFSSGGLMTVEDLHFLKYIFFVIQHVLLSLTALVNCCRNQACTVVSYCCRNQAHVLLPITVAIVYYCCRLLLLSLTTAVAYYFCHLLLLSLTIDVAYYCCRLQLQ